MRKIDWSKAAALALVTERAHSTLKDISPKYSDFVDNTIHKCKKLLHLTGTLGEELELHIGTKEIEWHWSTLPTSQHLYLLSHILCETVTLDKAFFLESKALDEFDSHGIIRFIKKLDELSSTVTKIDKLEDIKEKWSPDYISYDLPDDLAHLAPEVDIIYLVGTLVFARWNDIPIAFIARKLSHGKFFQICTIYPEKHEETITKLIEDLFTAKIDTYNPYRRSVISYRVNEEEKPAEKNSFLDDFDEDDSVSVRLCSDETIRFRYRKPNISLDAFTTEVKKLITEDIPGFIERQEELCNKGFDGRRSYILAGPPGSGKSHIISSIISRLPDDYTVVIVPPNDLSGLSWFATHDYITPLMFVVEDVDLIIGNDKERQALLNFLDGIRSPKKMLTLMTTNYPQVLGDSLIRRPGRVDRICYVLPGDEHERSAQISVLSNGITLPVSPEEIAKKTDGLTFSHHREIIRRAFIYSKNPGVIDSDSLNKSIDECQKQFTDDLKEWK